MNRVSGFDRFKFQLRQTSYVAGIWCRVVNHTNVGNPQVKLISIAEDDLLGLRRHPGSDTCCGKNLIPMASTPQRRFVPAILRGWILVSGVTDVGAGNIMTNIYAKTAPKSQTNNKHLVFTHRQSRLDRIMLSCDANVHRKITCITSQRFPAWVYN